jgi:hypothetical protein
MPNSKSPVVTDVDPSFLNVHSEFESLFRPKVLGLSLVFTLGMVLQEV